GDTTHRGARAHPTDATLLTLRQRHNDAIQSLDSEAVKLLREWPQRLESITAEVNEYQVRGKTIRVDNYRESLSHLQIPKIAAPTYKSWGELLTFLDRKSTRLNSSHVKISYAVFCLKKKNS